MSFDISGSYFYSFLGDFVIKYQRLSERSIFISFTTQKIITYRPLSFAILPNTAICKAGICTFDWHMVRLAHNTKNIHNLATKLRLKYDQNTCDCVGYNMDKLGCEELDIIAAVMDGSLW